MSDDRRIVITADGVGTVKVLLDSAAVQADGYGGWTTLARERRTSLTVWEGKDPITLQVPVIFDGLADLSSQEVSISTLSRMALPPTTGGEPPTIKISGPGIPKVGPVNWVIQSLKWGTNVSVERIGGIAARVRQDCVINLLQYVAPDRLAFRDIQLGSSSATGASKTGWPKTYVTKKGETLRKVALKFYGDAGKWKLIADANGISDPNAIKTGTRLRIPAP